MSDEEHRNSASSGDDQIVIRPRAVSPEKNRIVAVALIGLVGLVVTTVLMIVLFIHLGLMAPPGEKAVPRAQPAADTTAPHS